MASVKFYVRTSKKQDSKKPISIRIRFSEGGKFDTHAKSGLEVIPEKFDSKKQRTTDSADDSTKDNDYLHNLEKHIRAEYKKLKDIPTTEWLVLVVDKFRFPEKYQEKKITLFDFIQTFIDEAPERIIETGRTVSLRTIQDYKKTRDELQDYSDFKKIDLDFSDIDKDFYKSFVKYLTVTRNLSKNTVGKKIKVLKIFLNAASPKHISKGKFDGFTTLTEDSQSIYLSEEELQNFYDIDLSNNPKLDRVRDMFIVGAWTGLRYSDWDKVRSENIEDDFLTIFTDKTGDEITIPIHPNVKAILKKYNGMLPTPISNQKYNEYLTDVSELAEIQGTIAKQITKGGKKKTNITQRYKLVTTHTARRSFATNMYKMGVPSITIMAITGHKKESTFLKYIKVTKKEHAKKMREIWLQNMNHLKIAK